MCTNSNHVVGEIATKIVRHADWPREASLFEAKIDDFNTRGQRDQINHPGYFCRFNFCPECGASLKDLEIRALTWGHPSASPSNDGK